MAKRHYHRRKGYHLKKKRHYKGRRHFHLKHKRKTESRRGWSAKHGRRGTAASVRIIKHRSTHATRVFTVNAVGQRRQRIRSLHGDRLVNAPRWSRRAMAIRESPQHMRIPRHRWF